MRGAAVWPAALLLCCAAVAAVGAVRAGPEPEPVSAGDVVWRADGSRPLHEEWASLATEPDCGVSTSTAQGSARVRLVDDPTSPSPLGRYYRIAVRTDDRCYGSRAEVAQGNPVSAPQEGRPDRLFRQGEERWISFAHRLADDYPLHDRGWSLVHQWKQTASHGGENGYPVLSFVASDGVYRMWGPGYSEREQENPPTGRHGSWGQDFSSDPSLGSWHLFTLHCRWSPDPEVGFVELHGDLGDGRGWRTLVPRVQVATMKLDDVDGSGDPIPVHARMGIYRDEDVPGGTHVDYAGYTVARTRQAAERAAFRADLRPPG